MVCSRCTCLKQTTQQTELAYISSVVNNMVRLAVIIMLVTALQVPTGRAMHAGLDADEIELEARGPKHDDSMPTHSHTAILKSETQAAHM
eukprot:582687-Amphidinium_carterae.1